jgi:chloramphenicol-sensitive protein RarD
MQAPASVPGAPRRAGLAPALAAYISWGVFPLYFKALRRVPPLEILSHRVVWSTVFLAALVLAGGRGAEWCQAFRSARRLGIYLLSTALVTCNWLLYIWGVASGRVLEGSLGYFIGPIVNVVLGMLFLGERLRPRQIGAVALAAAGVLVMVLRAGTVPWLALGLAVSFSSYSLVRKKAAIDPVVGLLVETSLLAPFAVALIVGRALAGTGQLGARPLDTGLLLAAGVLTAFPLIWFARGVRQLRLSTMGLIQYISPTVQFLLAVLLFGERFTSAHAMAFGCIWLALALYSLDALTQSSVPASSAPSSVEMGRGAALSSTTSATKRGPR